MDFSEVYHFLFETYMGIGLMILVALVVCVIVCAIWEVRTRKTYKDRGPREDEWALFDDEDNEDEEDAD